MLFSRDRQLADRVVELLVSSPQTIREILTRLSDSKPVSERAVYKTVEQLVDAEVLIKVGKRVRVNQEWQRDLVNRLSSASLPEIAPGERIAYTFSSIERLDAFWKTIVLAIERYEMDGKIFFYNPHNFWAYIPERKASEKSYYEHFAKEKRHAFFTIGGETPADMEFKQSCQDEYLQIDTRAIPALARNAHITVLGDHIITVRLPQNTAARIDKLYESNRSIGELGPEIKMTYQNTRIRFVIENNPLRAAKLRRMLSLNFYFTRRD